MTGLEEEGEGVEEEPAGRGRIAPAGFVAVVDGEGRLLFYFDPERDLVQIRVKGRTSLVDLRMHRRERAQGKMI